MNSSSSSLVARWSAAPASSPSSPPNPEESSEPESWAERFYAALPLFIVGGVCVVMALELYAAGAETSFGGNGSVRLQPWILFVALGITGLCAGTVALFAENAFAEPREAGKVTLTPAPAPAWDESSIELNPMTLGRRRTWEADAESLQDVGPEPSSPDGFLDQLDEIEVSLRRKGDRPPPE